MINDFSTHNPRVSNVLRMQALDERTERLASVVHTSGRLIDFCLQAAFLPLVAASAQPALVALFWISLTKLAVTTIICYRKRLLELLLLRNRGVRELSGVATAADVLLLHLLLNVNFASLVTSLFYLGFLPLFTRNFKRPGKGKLNGGLIFLAILFTAAYYLTFFPGFGCMLADADSEDWGQAMGAGVALVILKALRLAVSRGREDMKVSELITHYSSRETLDLVWLFNTNLLEFIFIFGLILGTWSWESLWGSVGSAGWLMLVLAALLDSFRVAIRFALPPDSPRDTYAGILTRVALVVASWALYHLLEWRLGLILPQLLGFGLMGLLVLEMRRANPPDPISLFDLNTSTGRVERLTRVSRFSESFIHKASH